MSVDGPRLSLTAVDHRYGSEPVLTGIDLEVRAGETVALIGPSGCGKSTLLLLACGILRPTAGHVVVHGTPLQASAAARSAVRRRAIGMVFQFGELIAELTLLDNVALAAELAGARRKEALARAAEILDEVGLSEQLRRKPADVSGGQAQRCAIARALVHRPALVLADEPTGALDEHNAAVSMRIMIDVTRKRGAGLLVATHDRSVAASCDRVVRMRDGSLDGES